MIDSRTDKQIRRLLELGLSVREVSEVINEGKEKRVASPSAIYDRKRELEDGKEKPDRKNVRTEELNKVVDIIRGNPEINYRDFRKLTKRGEEVLYKVRWCIEISDKYGVPVDMNMYHAFDRKRPEKREEFINKLENRQAIADEQLLLHIPEIEVAATKEVSDEAVEYITKAEFQAYFEERFNEEFWKRIEEILLRGRA